MTLDWSQVDALLLDLDGTLVDTEGLHIEAHRQTLVYQGITLTAADIAQNIGGSDRQFYQELKSRHGHLCDGQSGDVQAWLDHKDSVYDALVDAGMVSIMPGVAALIEHAVSHALAMAVVTNSRRHVAERLLRQVGLAERLAVRVCWEDTDTHKPNPAPYQRGLMQVATIPQRAIAIEDSVPGVRSATAAGIYCIGCSDYISAQQLREAGAQRVVQSLEELVP